MSPFKGNLYLFIILILNIVFSFVLISLQLSPAIELIVFQCCSLLLPFIVYMLLQRQMHFVPRKKLSPRSILFIVLISMFIQPIMSLLSAISTIFYENNVVDMVVTINEYPLIFSLAIISFMPAILEEITLRGVVLTHYQNVSYKKAFLMNGLLFGIMHLNGQQFLYAFAMGIIFAYFVQATGSIYASILSHMVINGSQMILVRFYMILMRLYEMDFQEELAAAQEATSPLASIISTLVMAAVVTPVVFILFRSFAKENPLPERETTDNSRVLNIPFVGCFIIFAFFVIALPIYYYVTY